MTLKVLVVDGDKELRRRIFTLMMTTFSEYILQIKEAASTPEAFEAINNENYDFVFFEAPAAAALLPALKTRQPHAFPIVSSSREDQQAAREALSSGAFGYLPRPPEQQRLVKVVRSALRVQALLKDVSYFYPIFEDDLDSDFSQGFKEFFSLCQMVSQVAESQAPVLIRGEAGTGKELLAQTLHLHSSRNKRPFVTLRCSSSPDITNLFTSPLENPCLAQGGTLFLQEITDLSQEQQRELLPFLKTPADQPPRFRVVAATRECLEKKVREGKFLAELMQLLEPRSLFLPPLRERREAIETLCLNFLKKLQAKYNKVLTGLHPQTLQLLRAYSWPGNVAELYKTLEEAYQKETSAVLTPGSLPPRTFKGKRPGGGAEGHLPEADQLKKERSLILQALKSSGGQINSAMATAGIPKNLFLRKLKKLDIDVSQFAQR